MGVAVYPNGTLFTKCGFNFFQQSVDRIQRMTNQKKAILKLLFFVALIVIQCRVIFAFESNERYPLACYACCSQGERWF